MCLPDFPCFNRLRLQTTDGGSYSEGAAAQPPRSMPSVPAAAPVAPPSTNTYVEPASSKKVLSEEDKALATKFSKFAVSALTYDDVPTAVENLLKALRTLGVDGI